MTTSIPPSQTLYVKNLDSKVKKVELRRQLYALFTVYGRVLDVVATRANGMRGQAFVVFENIQTATSALRGLADFTFYGKPLDISYAKTKSKAVLRRELGTDAVLQLQLDGTLSLTAQPSDAVTLSQSRKRTGRTPSQSSADGEETDSSDDDEDQPGPQSKRPKIEETFAASISTQSGNGASLLCSNLPQEITRDMLSALFQQFDGLNAVAISPANDDPATFSTALVSFQTTQQAQVAKEGLDGFRLSPTHTLQLTIT